MGTVDLADVHPCLYCGVEVLHVADVDGNPIQLDPHVVFDGSTVGYGWRLQDGRWVVHVGSVSPDLSAFRPHRPCERASSAPKGQPRMTQPDPFGQASAPGAGGLSMEELQGKLVLFTCSSIEKGLSQTYPDSLAVLGDVVDLATGEEHTGQALWGNVITRQFKPGIRYVGRVGKGVPTGSNSPPWVWHDGDDNDKAVAVKYLTYAAGQSVGTTAQTPAPAAAQPLDTPASAPPPWAS